MTNLPTGTVTFLFTDIEGSTQLWEKYPEAMQGVLAAHDSILRAAIESSVSSGLTLTAIALSNSAIGSLAGTTYFIVKGNT